MEGYSFRRVNISIESVISKFFRCLQKFNKVGDTSYFKMRQKLVLHISYPLEVVNPAIKAAGLSCMLVYPLSDHTH